VYKISTKIIELKIYKSTFKNIHIRGVFDCLDKGVKVFVVMKYSPLFALVPLDSPLFAPVPLDIIWKSEI